MTRRTILLLALLVVVEPRLPLHAAEGEALPPGIIARLGRPGIYHPGGTSLVVSPDGKKIISCSSFTGTVKGWEPTTGKELGHFAVAARGSALLGFGSGGKILVTTNQASILSGFDLETGKEVEVASGKKGAAGVVCLSGDGHWAARLQQDGSVHLWDLAGEKESRQILAPSDEFKSVQGRAPSMYLSRDGKMILLCRYRLVENMLDPDRRYEWTSAVSLYDVEAGKRLYQADLGFKSSAMGVAFRPTGDVPGPAALAPDGKTIAFFKTSKSVALVEVEGGKILRTLELKRGLPQWLTFTPNGKTVAAMVGGTLRLWDAESGKELPSPEGLWGASDVSFSADGKTLAIMRVDNIIDIWDLTTGKPLRPLGLGTVTGATAPSDGKQIVTLGRDGMARIWDVESGKETQAWRVHSTPTFPVTQTTSVAFSVDNRSLLTGGTDGTLALWDLTAEKPTAVWGPTSAGFRSAAFSEDGRWVLAQRTNGEWAVLEIKAGDVQRTFAGSPFFVSILVDTRLQLGTNNEGDLTVRDLGTGRELYRLGANGRKKPLIGAEKPPVGIPIAVPQSLQFLGLSPDGKTLATAENTAGSLKEIKLWEVSTGLERGRLPLVEAGGDKPPARPALRWVSQFQFSPDGTSVLALEGFSALGGDQAVCRWDLGEGTLVRSELPTPVPPTLIKFLPGTNRWFAAAPNGTLLIGEGKPAPAGERAADKWEPLATDLASRDGTRAFRARIALKGVPDVVVWLERHVKPTSPDAAAVRELVAALSEKEEQAADKAVSGLDRLGEAAEPYLREAWNKKPTPETRKRLELLLAKLDDPANFSEMRLRGLRGVEVLESMNTKASRKLLQKWAEEKEGELPSELTRASRAALDRLGRRLPAE